ncbi:MAG TPA: alanine racemase [Thermomicrobiales bacterium]|nr:alanine racemase [Thermomicrobiales bacterium]
MTIEGTARRYMAGAHALIDLDAYAHNIRALRAAAPAGSAFMAVVKADAYGHGAIQCALAAESVANWLGVARIQEALAIRNRGVRLPILVLGPANAEEVESALVRDITLTVGAVEHVEQAAQAARKVGVRATVHLKIDTGMRRYGVMPRDAAEIAELIARQESLHLEGVFTHFSSADESDAAPTERQIAEFDAAIKRIRGRGIEPRLTHCANSAAILAKLTGTTNLVRSGIATFGISPSAEVLVPPSFQQIMSFRTVATRVFDLEPGDGVSYGLSYRAQERERVAATAAGYADGLPRQLSNTGWFALGDACYPIRGRVCMDQTVIASDERMAIGDIIDIIRPAGSRAMTLDDVARIAGTNSYEIATRITARVPRLYVRAGKVVACEHTLLGESVVAGQP